MKNGILHMFICLLCMAAASCERRPLTNGDNNVLVDITIDKEIINYTMTKDPSMMRVMFFDSNTGKFASQAFLPSRGGLVNVLPGRTYDILAYNFDTENIVIGEEERLGKIFASTNEVPETYRSKLKSRGTSNEGEIIVFEPDHLFVGRATDVYIPARGADAPPVAIDLYASTVVETWKIYIRKVQGMEWVGGIAGVITGLSRSNTLASDEESEETVSVFFESVKADKEGNLEITFNTFGYNPRQKQVISLVITDISGKGHEFNIDASKEFIGNKEQIIRINTDDIIIDKPESSEGGGLNPDVDDWENIETDIII